MFWGCAISEKKPYAAPKGSNVQIAHITNVALSKTSDVGKTYLIVTKGKESFTLACLQKDKVESHSLDLYLTLDQNLTLTVSGKGEMHVTGYLEIGSDVDSDEEAFIEGSLEQEMAKVEEDSEEDDSEEDEDEAPKKKQGKKVEKKTIEPKKVDQKREEQKKSQPKKQEHKKVDQKKQEQRKPKTQIDTQLKRELDSDDESEDNLVNMEMQNDSDDDEDSDKDLKKVLAEKKREAPKVLPEPTTKKLKPEVPTTQPGEGKKKKKHKKNKPQAK